MFHLDNDNKKLLQKHLYVENELLELFTHDEIDNDKLYEIIEEMNNLRSYQTNKTKFKINNDFVSQKKNILDSKNLSLLNNLYNETLAIKNSLDKTEIATFDVTILINFLNNILFLLNETKDEIRELTLQKLILQDINGKILVLSDEEKSNKIPLIFKNGKKIILTNSNFDFSLFNYDELIEILRVLDIIITDNKYDVLRTEISKHIASISNFSLSE